MSEQGGPKKPIRLNLEVCYSGFKVEELEYIDYSRGVENAANDFLETFSGKPDNGETSEDEDDEEIVLAGNYGLNSRAKFAIEMDESRRSYLCSTPTAGRKHRGAFPQDIDVDFSEFNDFDCVHRNYASTNNTDSGIQTRNFCSRSSIISLFADEGQAGNEMGAGRIQHQGQGSTESLADYMNAMNSSARKKIGLDSGLRDPYGSGNPDEFEISIEEEISQMSHNVGNGNTTLGTLRRRLSLKVLRRHISTGLFGSYLQRPPERPFPPASQTTEQEIEPIDQVDDAPLLNKRPGPVNLWFRKFRNRHYI